MQGACSRAGCAGALRIPSQPHDVYKDRGWTGWVDFFGLSDKEYKSRARRSGKRASAAAAQKLVDSGEARTLAEARSLRAKRARDAYAQKLAALKQEKY